ncbi:MAG: T9SS type A sorting domain-containing protein, partial [Bacteroidota bacterium]
FQQHQLRYRLFNTSEWNDVAVQGQEWLLTNLLPCEDYEYQMAPICGDGPGFWSASYFFTTDCGPLNTTEQSPISDLRVWPNPFVSELNIQGLLQNQGTSIRAQLIQYNGQMIERWWITAQELETGHQKAFSENLPSGVYWLELQQGDQRQTLPLVRP